MKQFRYLFVVAALAASLAASSSVFAGSSKKKPTPAPIQTPTIASVTPTSITINEAKTTKTYAINQFTEINVNGARATAAELKPGMGVSVVVSTDATKVSRINATGK
jgi:hypothetical protein